MGNQIRKRQQDGGGDHKASPNRPPPRPIGDIRKVRHARFCIEHCRSVSKRANLVLDCRARCPVLVNTESKSTLPVADRNISYARETLHGVLDLRRAGGTIHPCDAELHRSACGHD